MYNILFRQSLDASSLLAISTFIFIKSLFNKPYNRQQTWISNKIKANHNITAQKVRLIGNDGKQLGVFNLGEAIQKAQGTGLDLVQITEKVEPPICKIIDYGKYLYQIQKKEKKQKAQKNAGLKNIRLGFNISPHDLETRAKTAEKFLKKGCKVQVEMQLRGRERALSAFSEEKIKHFLEILNKSVVVKIERELKRQPRGLTMIIAKQ